MAIVFPGGLDNFTNPTPADTLSSPAVLHTDQHSDLNDAVEALEAKVGINNSGVTGSLDYRVTILVSGTHSPVTLGTANGLSLSGQVLSLALSATGTSGALSGLDYSRIAWKNEANVFTAAQTINIANSVVNLDDIFAPGITLDSIFIAEREYTGAATGTYIDAISTFMIANPSANTGAFFNGAGFQVVIPDDNSKNIQGITGLWGRVRHKGSGNLAQALGLNFVAFNEGSGNVQYLAGVEQTVSHSGSGEAATIYGVYNYVEHYGGGTTDEFYGEHLDLWVGGIATIAYGSRISLQDDGATAVTGYGLKIDDVDLATTNYAIYTGAGAIRFGGAVTLANYTSNGFLRTSGSNGSLYIDTTSYQSLLSFPLAANLGGTGILNSGTFTNHQNLIMPANSAGVLTNNGSGTLTWSAASGVGGSGVVGQLAEWVTNTTTLQAAKLIAPTGAILTLVNANEKSITFPGSTNDTVAMLGTENVFIAKQSITQTTGTAGNTLFIQDATPGTGFTQLTLKGGALSSSTDPEKHMLTVLSSAGVEKAWIRGDGAMAAVYVLANDNASYALTDTADGNVIKGINLSKTASIQWGNDSVWYAVKDIVLERDSDGNGELRLTKKTTTTNAVVEALRIQTEVSTGATGGANGFGMGLSFYAETATDFTIQQQGLISTSWIDATNASRKAKMSLSAYDTAVRLGIEIEASGSAVKLGFFGHATSLQSAAYTPTNVTTDRSYDANSTSIDEIADVLGTLIADLQSLGLVA